MFLAQITDMCLVLVFCDVFGKQPCGSQHKYLFTLVDQRDFTTPAPFQQFLGKS